MPAAFSCGGSDKALISNFHLAGWQEQCTYYPTKAGYTSSRLSRGKVPLQVGDNLIVSTMGQNSFRIFLVLQSRRPYSGRWESRMMEAGTDVAMTVINSGLCYVPLALEVTGGTVKDCSEISIVACSLLFTNPMLLQSSRVTVKYEVLAVVFHLGDEPHSGHYRTVLAGVSSGATGESRDGCVFYLSDDNVPLCESTALEPEVNHNGYLIRLRRVMQSASL